MPRNLDLTALRSLATVADLGGVTRAAGQLHLTQSAVSMQLKRLEEGLGIDLIDRSQRSVQLTPAGEQLLSYARRMLVLNDEAIARMTDDVFEGVLTLGAPHDVLYPAIPPVLAAFAQRFPRMQLRLQTDHTRHLKELFRAGECDVILTTEDSLDEGGETLVTVPLKWIGATAGVAFRARPLKLVFCRNCIFAPVARRHLDAAGIDWGTVIDSDSDRALEAAVIADLGICALIDAQLAPGMQPLGPEAGLPALPDQRINLYRSAALPSEISGALAELLRGSYAGLARPRVAAE